MTLNSPLNQSDGDRDNKVRKWIRDRRRSKIIAVIQFLLLGTEISLIFPTLGFYLKELGVKDIPLTYGVVCGAYNATGIIASLILTRIMDKTLRFSLIVSAINGITLFGNILYIIGYSPYILMLARAFNGIVEASFPIMYGELARCYSSKEFPRHAGQIMTAFVLGMAISPAFNFVPSTFEFYVGTLSIRYTNIPGVFLFCLYVVQVFVTLVFLPNISRDKQTLGIDVESLDLEAEGDSKMTYQSCASKKERLDIKSGEFDRGAEHVDTRDVIAITESNSQVFKNNGFDEVEDSDTFVFIESTSTISLWKYDLCPSHNGHILANSCHIKPLDTDIQPIEVSVMPWWKVASHLLKKTEIAVLLYAQAVWAYTLLCGVISFPNVGIIFLHLNHLQLSGCYIGLGFLLVLVMWTSSNLLVKFGPATCCIGGFLMNFTGTGFLLLVNLAYNLSPVIKFILFFIFAIGYFVGWIVNSVAIRATVSLHAPLVDQAFTQGMFTLVEQFTGILSNVSFGLSFRVFNAFSAWTMAINVVAIILMTRYHSRLSRRN